MVESAKVGVVVEACRVLDVVVVQDGSVAPARSVCTLTLTLPKTCPACDGLSRPKLDMVRDGVHKDCVQNAGDHFFTKCDVNVSGGKRGIGSTRI